MLQQGVGITRIIWVVKVKEPCVAEARAAALRALSLSLHCCCHHGNAGRCVVILLHYDVS
jgi:hypothetical protein